MPLKEAVENDCVGIVVTALQPLIRLILRARRYGFLARSLAYSHEIKADWRTLISLKNLVTVTMLSFRKSFKITM